MRTGMLRTGLMTIAISTMLVSVLGNNLLAQRGMCRDMNSPDERTRMQQCNLDLTQEQQAKFDELRIKHLKEITPLRNELNEKKARLQTLQSADKPDMNAINKTIDDISLLRGNIMKKKAAHRLEMASQLTDEQRVMFNAFPGGKGNKKGRCGHGMRRRNGNYPPMQQ